MALRPSVFKGFNGNPGATHNAVQAFETSVRRTLPGDYRELLMQCNGGEGFIGDNYLMLWRVEDLNQFNDDYDVESHIDDVLLIGSNGGGEAYGFDMAATPWRVIRVPFVGMAQRLVEHVAPDFSAFLEVLYESTH